MIYGGEARREQIAEILMSCPDLWHKENALSAADKVLATPSASPLRGREPPIAMVAAAQKAILNHPYFHDGAAIAFGFANTAVKAALSALPSKQPAAEDK